MEVENCSFPDDVLYDLDTHVWVRLASDDTATVGITSILSGIAGKLIRVKFRPVDLELESGRSLGTIESLKYVGAVRTPLTGRLVEVNHALESNPKLMNDAPYSEGWFARIKPSSLEKEISHLADAKSSAEILRSSIKELRVRCFKAYPDHEMYEIGVECAAVLSRLNELIEKISLGEVVHVVSDDPTADIEMIRWSEETGQKLLESRSEGNLMHFIVKKTS